jgi:histidinol-phosphate phosphatase family protein
MKNKNPVLFLDRDGTINIDIGPKYVSEPHEILLIPGAGRAIITAVQAGFKIAMITNQAGVAKGFTRADAFPAIHGRLEELIAREGGAKSFRFDDVRVCMHHPDDKCACRKPEIQNLADSIAKLDADLSRSFFIGDKETDLICAKRVGLRSILVRTGHGKKVEAELAKWPEADPCGVVDGLAQAVELATRLSAAV